MENRDVLRKAQLSLADLQSDGGYLPEEVALEFYKNMVKEGVLLSMVDVKPINSHTYVEPKIGFAGRILHAADNGVPLPSASRGKPTTSKMTINTAEFKSEVRLGWNELEDNVEGAKIQQTVLDRMKVQIAQDIDEIAINADTTSADADLAKFNGLFKLATSNVVDAGGATMSKTILSNMLKTLPAQFKKDKSRLVFMVSTVCEEAYRNTLAERATGSGDRYLAEDVPVFYQGSPVKSVPMFPENLGIGSNYASALYTDPRNVKIGLYKKLAFATDTDISAGELVIVARIRWGVNYIEESGVVKAHSILAA